MAMLSLTDVRAQAAAALAPVTSADPDVFVDVVESVSPPAILLVWGEPWLSPRTFGPCYFDANLDVLCVAARNEPGPGIETLEGMVEYVIGRLIADSYSWPQASSQAPRVIRIADVPYLAARVSYSVPVTTNGG